VDTIFALASGAGRAAIAVIRLSGAEAGAVLDRIAGRRPAPRRAVLRQLRDPGTDEPLDRGLVLWFPGPRSYTGEDSAELHLHGGRAVVAAVAAALVRAGARPAEPGEFTRRAFQNGRLDLTEAEGIADLIDAETEAQRRQALRQAEGGLAALHRQWRDRALRLLAHQEAAIEFADEDLPNDLEDRAKAGAAALRAEIMTLLAEGARGERLREGLEVTILGAPNAGKSSLLNALVGRETAIVSPWAGTTRDVVEARLDLGGVPVTLADTAGLRATEDEVEAEGVRRARQRGAAADLVLAVFAADRTPDSETLALLDNDGGPRILVVASKIDLCPPPAEIGGVAPAAVSLVTGEGLEALRQRLRDVVLDLAGSGEAVALTRPRHRAALADAAGWLEAAEAAPLPELVAEALRAALRALARLGGEAGVEEVLDALFRDFCIGK
jgi:tRNA modification GTPase